MKQNKETLKQFFETGDKPTQQQYEDLIDSYIDAKQPEGEANRRFVIDETGEVNVASEQQVPEYSLSPISGTNTVDLLKDGVSVSQIDLTPYLDNTNLARLVSGTVDTNGLATFTRDDNSTFTVDLSNLKDTVPQYQAGTNISIDSTDPLQPIINASGGSSGATNLSYSHSLTEGTIISDTGTNATIPVNSRNFAGLVHAFFYEEKDLNNVILGPQINSPYTFDFSGKFKRVGGVGMYQILLTNIQTTGSTTGVTLEVEFNTTEGPKTYLDNSDVVCIKKITGSNLTNQQIHELKVRSSFDAGSNYLNISFADLDNNIVKDVSFTNGSILLTGLIQVESYS